MAEVGAGMSGVLVVVLLLVAEVQVRVAGKHFENRFRHNRIAPLYETRHRFISQYQPTDLGKHEYKTVSETKRKAVTSRFPKLDRILNSLPRPVTPVATPSPGQSIFPWAPTSQNPLEVQSPMVMEFDADVEQTLGDDFQVDEFVPGTTTTKSTPSTESVEWDNNIGGEPQLEFFDVDNNGKQPSTSKTLSTLLEPILALTTPTTPMQDIHNLFHHGLRPNHPSVHHHNLPSSLPKAQQPEVPKVHLIEVPKNAMHTAYHSEKFSINTEENRRRKEEEKKHVMAHLERVKGETQCKVPRPKVIHVKDVYPHSSKVYLPHCTVIYQCGSDAGCCADQQTHTDHVQRVEQLEFYNHTECECQNKEDRSSRALAQQQPAPALLMAPSAPLCTCPKKYSGRLLPDGTCMCDCFHLQKECLRLKRGKDYFSREDQLCIKNGSCLLPSCEYGHYLRKNARCVRKEEMFSHWPKAYTTTKADQRPHFIG